MLTLKIYWNYSRINILEFKNRLKDIWIENPLYFLLPLILLALLFLGAIRFYTKSSDVLDFITNNFGIVPLTIAIYLPIFTFLLRLFSPFENKLSSMKIGYIPINRKIFLKLNLTQNLIKDYLIYNLLIWILLGGGLSHKIGISKTILILAISFMLYLLASILNKIISISLVSQVIILLLSLFGIILINEAKIFLDIFNEFYTNLFNENIWILFCGSVLCVMLLLKILILLQNLDEKRTFKNIFRNKNGLEFIILKLAVRDSSILRFIISNFFLVLTAIISIKYYEIDVSIKRIIIIICILNLSTFAILSNIITNKIKSISSGGYLTNLVYFIIDLKILLVINLGTYILCILADKFLGVHSNLFGYSELFSLYYLCMSYLFKIKSISDFNSILVSILGIILYSMTLALEYFDNFRMSIQFLILIIILSIFTLYISYAHKIKS